MRVAIPFVHLLLILTVLGCSPAPEVFAPKIEVSDPYVMAVLVSDPPSGMVYMKIRNGGNTFDRLVGVESDAANTVLLHQTVKNENSTSMQPVNAITVPAFEEVDLQPGGYHVMLMGIRNDVKIGTWITLTLKFEKSGNVIVTAEVKNP